VPRGFDLGFGADFTFAVGAVAVVPVPERRGERERWFDRNRGGMSDSSVRSSSISGARSIALLG
jgi:hypothetical protein